MNASDRYQLVDGRYGRRAVITGPWSEAITRGLIEAGAMELVLNMASGWRGKDLSFLSGLAHLKAFEIYDLAIPSVEPIHYLHELKRLNITTYCTTKIRFEEFPDLEECFLKWGRRDAKSLFECMSLRRLYVDMYKGHDTAPFGRLTNLESLAILNSPVKSVIGLGELKELRSLRLGLLRCLESLAGIERLAKLEELDIDTCRKIRAITEAGALRLLRQLHLNNCGDIESLRPLDGMHTLETLMFYGSTNIVDGDLSPLLRLERLSRVSFKNRRHYSHRREEVWRSLE